MNRYNEYNKQVAEQLAKMAEMALSRYFWEPALFSVLPTTLLFYLGSGALFAIYFVITCLWTRSTKLGGLVGFFIMSQTIFLYYSFPAEGHFIEYLLRAPAHSGGVSPTSQELFSNLPQTFSAKLFFSLVFGLRGGGVIGLGLGMLGRKIWD